MDWKLGLEETLDTAVGLVRSVDCYGGSGLKLGGTADTEGDWGGFWSGLGLGLGLIHDSGSDFRNPLTARRIGTKHWEDLPTQGRVSGTCCLLGWTGAGNREKLPITGPTGVSLASTYSWVGLGLGQETIFGTGTGFGNFFADSWVGLHCSALTACGSL